MANEELIARLTRALDGRFLSSDQLFALCRDCRSALSAVGEPDGYLYRYPSPWGGTVLRQEADGYNGNPRPLETLPYWFAAHPEGVGKPETAWDSQSGQGEREGRVRPNSVGYAAHPEGDRDTGQQLKVGDKCPKCAKELRYPLSHMCSKADLARVSRDQTDAPQSQPAVLPDPECETDDNPVCEKCGVRHSGECFDERNVGDIVPNELP